MSEPGSTSAGADVPTQASLLHPANLLTLARLLFAPLLFMLILQAEASRGASWAAFGLGVAMGTTDFFDGRVARRANVVSRSGAFLDPLADKVVVLGAGFCLVVGGALLVGAGDESWPCESWGSPRGGRAGPGRVCPSRRAARPSTRPSCRAWLCPWRCCPTLGGR